MTDARAFLERVSTLSPKRLALLALELQSKLDATARAETEPIAVIGMGCRFPGGADSPEAYWRLLRDGVDAITEIPAARWDVDALYDPDPDAPGKIATRWGGFLEGIDRFDAHFFGIAPREAMSMDPQQRLLLEVAWEALEHAGYAPEGLGGSATGVFVGICNGDYYQMLMAGDPQNVDAYLATGNAHSVCSGRISYLLGLQGPSLSVDTACSSSLVAVHLACQSLRQGECRTALAGGVNAVLSPNTTLTLSRARMMASDGRCKAFDASADGFVRSEGCGVVVLKRLSDALADGDRVLALLRGTAINQDGRSNGLTAPNGASQVAVIRAALADAGIAAADVGYVETHGTGTALGDPIEARALGAALGPDRPTDKPLMIGSVKTNLGHLEAAAGIAGLIKVVLALANEEIPPHLHLRQLSPHIPWDELPLTVPTERTAWPTGGERRVAGVSSFGFSGTNAHVIVEEAPPPRPRETAVERPVHLLTLSAKSDGALHELAERFERYLAERPDASLADVAYTANSGRSHFAQRLAVVAADAAALRGALADWLADREPRGVFRGQLPAGRVPEVVFMFPGQGCQYAGMGRQLYETQPTFRAAIDRCAELLRPHLDRPLLSLLWPAAAGEDLIASALLDNTVYTQPAIFAVEYALAELWRSWGIEPAAVLGHSAGEYVAACIAGVFSLDDALKLIAARGRLMGSLPANGAMASVRASEAHVAAAIAPYADQVAIAALNGPESVVVSGVATAVEAVIRDLDAEGIETRRLAISIAAHCPLVDPILDQFERTASEVRYLPPLLDVVSGLTGSPVSGAEITSPAYWRRHLREPVRFGPAIQTLREQGYRLLLEVGPSTTLTSMARHCLVDDEAVVVPSLRSGTEEWQQLLESAAALYVNGAGLDWAGFDRDYPRRRLALPTYPFQRERYWMAPSRPVSGAGRVSPGDPAAHPLLGDRLLSPCVTDTVFESRVSHDWPAFLDHHRIYGMIVMPSPAYIEMALAAARARWGPGGHLLEELAIEEPLLIPEDGARVIQTILADEDDGGTTFQVHSRAENAESWTLHARGRLRQEPAGAEPSSDATLAFDDVRTRCPEQLDGEAYYDKLHTMGLEFGSQFRGITTLWRRDGEALGQVDLPEALADEAALYRMHPAFLDACFHLLGAPLPDDGTQSTYLLVGIDRVRFHTSPGGRVWNHTVLREGYALGQETFAGDVKLYGESGQLVAEVEGLHLKRADQQALLRATRQHTADWLYEVEWQLAAPADAEAGEARAKRPPEPTAIAAQVAPQFAALSAEHGLAGYRELLPQLEALSAAYVVQALRRLGWQFPIGVSTSTAALVAELGVVDQHRRLFERLLAILEEEGILRSVGDGWEVVRPPDFANGVVDRAARLLAQYPGHRAEIELTSRCGEQLADVLRGDCDPLQLLFPNGSLETTERLYADSPFARVYNTLIREAVRTAVARVPAQGKLRVLEIGAGTGATTAAVLPVLPPERTEYVFTDVSPLFTTRAAEKFAAYPFLTGRLLDVERDPAEQGFAAGQFDLVLASNVLHATADLRRTLQHVARLLAPGGLLLLLEGTVRQRWVDLTFGLTEGWWRFRDRDLRPSYPLLSASCWTALLTEAGFVDAVAVPADGDRASKGATQAVLLARAAHASRAPVATEASGRWLILADGGGIGAQLAERVRAAGMPCALVSSGAYGMVAAAHWQIDPTRPADYQRLLREAVPAGAGPCRIVHLWGLDAPSAGVGLEPELLEASATATCGSALYLLQALAADESSRRAALWLVTRGAQPAGDDGAVVGLAQAPLWGLGRVIALEHAEVWGGLVDLPLGRAPVEDAEALFTAIVSAAGEDQLALRPDGRYRPRLIRRPTRQPQPLPVDRAGSYLITGGLGGLGLKVARWLADQGAGHLVLVGRGGLPARQSWASLPSDSRAARQAAAVRAIEAQGTEVTIVAADVADRAQMGALFARFGGALPPLRGIVHAAAALGGQLLRDMPPETLAAMLRPKVQGTWVLHELSETLVLDFFVLFSSTTALWGSRDLGHYAAANAFLDAFAHYRRARGLQALAINWGTWDEMRVASSQERAKVAQFGLNPLPSDQALDVLGGLLGHRELAQITVAAVDWSVLKPAYEAKRPRPFLAEVGPSPEAKPTRARARPRAEDSLRLVRAWESAPPDERDGVVVTFVREEVRRALGLEPTYPLDVQQGLFELGMDSLMSVDLKGRLQAAVGQTLPSTLTFNYPTIAALAGYLTSEVLAQRAAGPAPSAPNGHDSPNGYHVQQGESPAPGVPSDDLSEDELASLLAARLARIQ